MLSLEPVGCSLAPPSTTSSGRPDGPSTTGKHSPRKAQHAMSTTYRIALSDRNYTEGMTDSIKLIDAALKNEGASFPAMSEVLEADIQDIERGEVEPIDILDEWESRAYEYGFTCLTEADMYIVTNDPAEVKKWSQD